MSVRVMSLVWDTPLSPTQKLILLKLADNASDDGRNAYPAVETIARQTGLDRRSVQRGLRCLESRGLIEVERYEAACHPRSYRITLAPRGVHLVHRAQ